MDWWKSRAAKKNNNLRLWIEASDIPVKRCQTRRLTSKREGFANLIPLRVPFSAQNRKSSHANDISYIFRTIVKNKYHEE